MAKFRAKTGRGGLDEALMITDRTRLGEGRITWGGVIDYVPVDVLALIQCPGGPRRWTRKEKYRS